MRPVLIAFLLLVPPRLAAQGVSSEKRPNLLPASLWTGVKLGGRGFYSHGFSADGWFAYSRRPQGDLFDGTTESCPSPPCRDAVTIVSLACKDPCHSDAPSTKGDLCWCPIGSRLGDLARFKIKPLARGAHGRFPSTIDGQRYALELRYGKRLIYSESGADPHKPVFPGTQVFLVSRRSGRQLLATLDHNHRGIVARSVKAIGWVRSPVGKHLAVVLGYLTRANGARVIEVEVIGATLP